jgi:peroxiredoxin
MASKTWPAPAPGKLLIMALLLLALAAPAWPQSAPDFALKDVLRGQTYTLSQFRGKVVLLNFFTFECKPCRAEMPAINQINQELQGRGFQTLGIGLASTPAQLGSLARQLGLDYPVLAGNDQVSQAYGRIEFVPTTFIIDRQGQIVHKVTEALSKDAFLKLLQPLL